MASIPPVRKLRLYDRFCNWVSPLSPDDVLYLNQERENLVQYERILKAEADRLELENRAKLAEVALVEEENTREREAMARMHVVARAEFGLQSKIKERWTPITCIVTLSQSSTARQLEYKVINRETLAVVQSEIGGTRTFVEHNANHEMFLTPWLQGTLDLEDLASMEPDNCFEEIAFVGGKKPG